MKNAKMQENLYNMKGESSIVLLILHIKNMKKRVITIILLNLVLILGIKSVFAENKNNNPLLMNILIDGKEMETQFDPFISDYVLATNKEKITIEAKTDDPNAKAQIIGNTNLSVGINNIEIKVTAEDGVTTQSYYLHITRGDVNKANANLKNIEIEGYELNPQFNKRDVEYLIKYTQDIKNLNIKATPESNQAKVEIINNSNFNSLYHVVTIKVTAEDGITTKEYKIRAKKVKENAKEDDYEEEGQIEENNNTQQEEINEEAENMQDEEMTDENSVLTDSIPNETNNSETSNNGNNIWIYCIIGLVLIVIVGIIIFKKIKK